MIEKLSFTTTSLQNVVISNDLDSIYYDIVTGEWNPGLTTIKRLNPSTELYDVVAELENTNGRPVAVRMHGRESISVEQFLRVEIEHRNILGVWNGKAHFKGLDGKGYTWMIENGVLQLIRDDSTLDKPLAIFHPHKHFMYYLGLTELPSLDVEPQALDVLDTLIVTLVLIEGRRRGYFY